MKVSSRLKQNDVQSTLVTRISDGGSAGWSNMPDLSLDPVSMCRKTNYHAIYFCMGRYAL